MLPDGFDYLIMCLLLSLALNIGRDIEACSRRTQATACHTYGLALTLTVNANTSLPLLSIHPV